jgi:hypothetical protein
LSVCVGARALSSPFSSSSPSFAVAGCLGSRTHQRHSEFHPFLSILTEIYQCHTCSCHEILRMETPGQVDALVASVLSRDGRLTVGMVGVGAVFAALSRSWGSPALPSAVGNLSQLQGQTRAPGRGDLALAALMTDAHPSLAQLSRSPGLAQSAGGAATVAEGGRTTLLHELDWSGVVVLAGQQPPQQQQQYHLRNMIIMLRTLDWLRFTYGCESRSA